MVHVYLAPHGKGAKWQQQQFVNWCAVDANINDTDVRYHHSAQVCTVAREVLYYWTCLPAIEAKEVCGGVVHVNVDVGDNVDAIVHVHNCSW